MWYQRSWHFFKTLTRAETSHFLLCKERHYLPWLLTAGCLNQNQEGGGSGSSRDGSGWRQRKACVFVHVLVPQKGKWFFWVWFLAELLFGGGGYGEQITMNTLQVAKVWGKGTMTGLYFPACLCNFIINVSESSFYCLRLSIWPSQAPSLPPHPVTASSSIHLSLAKLYLLWEAFPDSPGYLAILCVFWMSSSCLWFCMYHTVSW